MSKKSGEKYAHSLPGGLVSQWEPLEDHVRNVSELARAFSERFNAGPLGAILGKWHDTGKLSESFQKYLLAVADNDESAAELRGSVDHSTPGGQHLVDALGRCDATVTLANTILGHHGGLLDHIDAVGRLERKIDPWKTTGYEDLLSVDPGFLEWIYQPPWAGRVGYTFGFFVRMIFSCLVDADYLCTERFLSPYKSTVRSLEITTSDLLKRFFSYRERVLNAKEDSAVNRTRREVLETALERAKLAIGLFKLTAPTGTGKTLSSLAFALVHAVTHGLDRVIYVIPYTSIIEQTAQEFRQVLGNEAVLEHHSNLAEGSRTFQAALASENWDAPVVVTTSVQFFESLHSNRPSRCRKLHRLAKSVIILDEAQTIPVKYLHPCLKCLDELSSHYGSSVVLATATQPALDKSAAFPIGLSGAREIAPEPKRLCQTMQRTKVINLGKLSRQELKSRLEGESQALCIVNTTGAARDIYRSLESPHKRHLSSRMVPWARRERMEEIRTILKNGDPLIVVSTQLVEAGVDLDFPVVFRAECGIDSLGQANGRCNREGNFPFGTLYWFQDETPPPRGELTNQAVRGMEVYGKHEDDPLGLDAIHEYFRVHYGRSKSKWDEEGIITNLEGRCYNFRTAAQDFNYIEEATHPVVVALTEDARRTVDRFEASEDPSERRKCLRKLQQHTVNVWEEEWNKGLSIWAFRMVGESLAVLTHPDTYDTEVGLLKIGEPVN